MHVGAALCVALSSLELLAPSTSLGTPFYPINILIPLSAFHSLSTSTEELSTTETAVRKKWNIYSRMNFLAVERCCECGPREQCAEVL